MVKRFFKFKTLFTVLAAILLAVAFAFAGCAEYTPPGGNDGSGGNGTDTPTTPGDDTEPDVPPTPTEEQFTVKLIYNRGDFNSAVCKDVTKLQAQWTDEQTGQVYRANFDEDGVAARSDLDGDYKVTLVTLPRVGETDYTYRPNDYTVNNNSKSARIMLYAITPMAESMQVYKGNIDDPNQGNIRFYDINTIGAYRIKLMNRNDRKYFSFHPTEQGAYTVKSLVDVTRDAVNPIMDMYNGSMPNYVQEKPTLTQDDGGPEGLFTKNFVLEYNLPANEVGNGLTFRLRSTAKGTDENAYGAGGLTVDFIIDRDGSFENEFYESKEIIPEENFENAAEKAPAAGTSFKKIGIPNTTAGGETRYILDADKEYIKFNKEDGYYWKYEVTGEDENGRPVLAPKARLYARLVAGATSSDAESKSLNILSVNRLTAVDLYYVAKDGKSIAKDYRDFVKEYLAHCYPENGCYPVSEELKTFLQDYSVYRRFFNDGNTGYGLGAAEVGGYDSDEDSQWLLVCGYFA